MMTLTEFAESMGFEEDLAQFCAFMKKAEKKGFEPNKFDTVAWRDRWFLFYIDCKYYLDFANMTNDQLLYCASVMGDQRSTVGFERILCERANLPIKPFDAFDEGADNANNPLYWKDKQKYVNLAMNKLEKYDAEYLKREAALIRMLNECASFDDFREFEKETIPTKDKYLHTALELATILTAQSDTQVTKRVLDAVANGYDLYGGAFNTDAKYYFITFDHESSAVVYVSVPEEILGYAFVEILEDPAEFFTWCTDNNKLKTTDFDSIISNGKDMIKYLDVTPEEIFDAIRSNIDSVDKYVDESGKELIQKYLNVENPNEETFDKMISELRKLYC